MDLTACKIYKDFLEILKPMDSIDKLKREYKPKITNSQKYILIYAKKKCSFPNISDNLYIKKLNLNRLIYFSAKYIYENHLNIAYKIIAGKKVIIRMNYRNSDKILFKGSYVFYMSRILKKYKGKVIIH